LKKKLTPPNASSAEWEKHNRDYYYRNQKLNLRAAECEFETWNQRECLSLYVQNAPLLTVDDWGGIKPNRRGSGISESHADEICKRIALKC
jgi:hypothetical protein